MTPARKTVPRASDSSRQRQSIDSTTPLASWISPGVVTTLASENPAVGTTLITAIAFVAIEDQQVAGLVGARDHRDHALPPSTSSTSV